MWKHILAEVHDSDVVVFQISMTVGYVSKGSFYLTVSQLLTPPETVRLSSTIIVLP